MSSMLDGHLRRNLAALLLAACTSLRAVAQETSPTEPVASSCRPDVSSWRCYGELEVTVTLTGIERPVSVLLQRFQIRHFSNGELLVTSEFAPEPNADKAYFVARPSGVELFRGWRPKDRPVAAVMAELNGEFKTLEAAFPGGPGSIEPGERSAIARVTRYVYPIGDREEEVAVMAHKNAAGTVLVQYEGAGEPLGPYKVTFTWSGMRPAPLDDDAAATMWQDKADLRFGRLGDVRGVRPRMD